MLAELSGAAGRAVVSDHPERQCARSVLLLLRKELKKVTDERFIPLSGSGTAEADKASHGARIIRKN